MTATVESRIVAGRACDYIDLLPEEAKFYDGAGWRIAVFVDDRLVEMWNPGKLPLNVDDPQAAADAAIAAALTYLRGLTHENWGKDCEPYLVMASCYQLCEPVRLVDDPAAFAKLARVLGEYFTEGDR